MRRVLTTAALTIAILSACDKNGDNSTQVAVLDVKANLPMPDTGAGKALTEKCVDCHGADGASGKPGVPFLAGQHAEYLAAAMRAYASGKRTHENMKTLLIPFGEQDFSNVAAYYAQLSAPWDGAAPPPAPQGRAFNKNTVAAGQAASRHCDSCHGADGNSNKAGVPSLAGLQPEYFTKALNAYFSGERVDPVMGVFKESLDKTEIKTMAAYYASQARLKTKITVKGSSAAGKTKSAACAGCHGSDGNSINPAMPSLAGQDAIYLDKALLAYHGGQRKDAMMQPAVAQLSRKDLRDLAAYYAAQEPHRPGELATAPVSGFDPVGDGARIAASCNACHGEQGNSTMPGVPSLSRLHSDYLATAIKAYRNGQRKNAMMKNFVLHLSDADIAKLALYYATQEPKSKTKPAKGNAAVGEKLATACNACHGDKGNSKTALTPSLAGQDSVYLNAAIRHYMVGARTHAEMQNAVKPLQENDLTDIAAYYTAQTAVKPAVHLPEATEVLVQKCNRCHGENGNSTDPAMPRLAGQVERYLAETMRAYKSGARDNSMMHAVADVLSDMEIDAVAAYYARVP